MQSTPRQSMYLQAGNRVADEKACNDHHEYEWHDWISRRSIPFIPVSTPELKHRADHQDEKK